MNLHKRSTLALIAGVVAAPLILSACSSSTEVVSGGSGSNFVNAAGIDLSGEWRREAVSRIETADGSVTSSDAPSDVTIVSLGNDFYEYSTTITVADDADPILHDGEKASSFTSSARMVVAPDGTLMGINLQDPMVANYWLLDENTMVYVLREAGANGVLVKGTFVRVTG
jgi:hypothetical protein